MKKKHESDGPDLISLSVFKILRVMKLIMVLICFIGLLSSFGKSYSQNTKLSIEFKNSSIENVLNYIESCTEYSFMYDNKKIDISQEVNINVKNQTIESIIDQLFENRVNYQMIGKHIIITPKESQLSTSAQQQKTISGKVTDSSGEPLPGVSVVVKGTTKGVITDPEGKYSLVNVPSNATVVFSFVGMRMQEVMAENHSIINVTMEENTIGIEEVVAVGYGTVRRKDLTGSVASVSGAVLKDIPVASAAQAITGRMPGVQVTQTEGSPDAEIKIRVRGGGSITQDNSPLFIVDGFPMDNINDIAPTDIASVDVLKDASSTAIYGARGANGVILITTKSGFEGSGKISYNTYWGVKKVTKTLDVLNPYEYVYWQYEVQNGDINLEKSFGDFQDYLLYKQIQGTNWQDEIFGKTGTSIYHNLSVSGGSKTSKYNISLTRNDEKEIMIGSGYERTNLTINTNHKINNWLNIDLNTRLSDYHLRGAGTSQNSRLAHAVQFRPINGLQDFVDQALVDADAYEISSSYILNPLLQTTDDYRRRGKLSFNINSAITAKISENLNYRFEYGTQYSEDTNKRFYGINTSNAINYGGKPLASIEKTNTKSYRLANILTYNKRNFLPDNNLSVMIGEELNYNKSEYIMSSAKYFPTYIDAVSALSMMQLGLADPITTADNPSVKMSSFFGRINYDYKKKYFLSSTFRADGSSKFAPGNQWGYFPATAIAWRISDEPFWHPLDKWVNDLKIRISYGESGNNRISDNAWQKTFTANTGGLFLDGDSGNASPTTYLYPNSILSNPRLKWETTITRNIGFDFGLLSQRINGSIELYKNTTNDLLISATIPSSTGYTTQWQNIGQTSNKGIEIVINGYIIEKKDFSLSASFNIGFNRNKIDKLGETKSWEQTAGWSSDGATTGDYLIKEGGQIGMMYGYVTDGMYSFDDFTYDNGYILKEGIPDDRDIIKAKKFWPGALKLKDQNNDYLITTKDKVVIGNANPKHTGGFNLTAQFRGFDFSTFFNWVYGNDIYNANKLYFTSNIAGRYYKNILNTMNSDNRFIYINKTTGQEVSDPTELAELNKNATIWSAAMSGGPLHSWVIEDGSFLRLNNITFGYSLSKRILDKLNVTKLRIYAAAYNLWTWTNYSGYDPEVDTQSSSLTPGIDWCAYPKNRSFNIGVNLEF